MNFPNLSIDWLETSKLVAQLVGALVVARFAVAWALKRYKAEKTWERRMVAYIEALSAIGEMERITGNQFDRSIGHREVSAEDEKAEADAYRIANRNLNDGIISARLLFSEKTSKILADLDEGLKGARRSDFYEDYLDTRFGALRKAKDALIEDGRETLQLD